MMKDDTSLKLDFLPGFISLIIIIMLPATLVALINLFAHPDLKPPLIIGIIILQIGYSFVAFLRSHLIYFYSQNRKPKDISSQQAPVTDGLKLFHEQLRSLGFKRLGEYEVSLPLTSGVFTGWCYINDDGTVLAELIDLEENSPDAVICTDNTPYRDDDGELVLPDPDAMVRMAQFTTHHRRGKAVVETIFPNGDTFEVKNFRVASIKTSLDAAYRYHLRQAAEYENQHGKPDVIRNRTDYAVLSRVYRRVHVLTKLGLPLHRNALLAAAGQARTMAIILSLLQILIFETILSPMLPFNLAVLVITTLVMVVAQPSGQDINNLKQKEVPIAV